jgi:serine/threonine protein kinase
MLSIGGDIIGQFLVSILHKKVFINGTWLWTYHPMDVNMDDMELIGHGGYGNVYRLQDGNILKIIKMDGYSENAAIYRGHKEYVLPIESIVGDQILDLYKDYTEEEDVKLDFIQQIKNEVAFQQIAYHHVKSINEQPVTAQVYSAGVAEYEGDMYGFIVMEEIIGFPLSKHVIETHADNKVFLTMIKDQLINIMEQIHVLGFVHNDMLRENVIITGDISNPVVKVIDWGISCMIWIAPFWTRIKDPSRVQKHIVDQIQKETEYMSHLVIDRFGDIITGPYLLDNATYRELTELENDIHNEHSSFNYLAGYGTKQSHCRKQSRKVKSRKKLNYRGKSK